MPEDGLAWLCSCPLAPTEQETTQHFSHLSISQYFTDSLQLGAWDLSWGMAGQAWEKAPSAQRAPHHFQEGLQGAKGPPGTTRATRLSLGDMGRKIHTPSLLSHLPHLYFYHPIPWDSGKFSCLHPFYPLQTSVRAFQTREPFLQRVCVYHWHTLAVVNSPCWQLKSLQF